MTESLAELVKKEAQQQRLEKAADNLGGFLSLVEAGKIPYPFLRSGDLVKMAINSPAPRINKETGYTDYPVFTGRDDEKRIFGIARALDRLGSNINSIALDNQRILMVVGPTGSGKSDIADIITDAVEKKASEVGPFYTLSGCLVRDNPLKILGPRARESFWEHYKTHIDGSLCPDCLEKFGGQLHDPECVLDIPVETYEYSAALGVGITRLDAKDTKPLETESWKRINSIVFGSSGGVLVISELQKINSEFLDTTHDLFRGRRYKKSSKVYFPDCFIIALTTTKEWQEFQTPEKNIPLVERTSNVYIPYNTAISKEAEIYRKTTRPFVDYTKQHLAPRLMEFLGEIAIRSRLKGESSYISGQFSKHPEQKKQITSEQGVSDAELIMLVKLALYDGQQIAGFTQMDRKIIEEEGLKKMEASQSAIDEGGRNVGIISPPFMSGKLYTMLHDYANNGESCLSPIKADRFFQDLIENAGDDFLKCRPKLIAWRPLARRRYEAWLVDEVKAAFLSNYEDTVKRTIDDYMDDIGIILLGGDSKNKMKKNPVTEKLEPLNTKPAETLEDKIFGKILNISDRHQFRYDVYRGEKKILPFFEEGVRKIVREEGNKAESILIQFPPRKEEDEERYQEALKQLLDPARGQDKFCKICAVEAMNRVAEILREKKGIK